MVDTAVKKVENQDVWDSFDNSDDEEFAPFNIELSPLDTSRSRVVTRSIKGLKITHYRACPKLEGRKEMYYLTTHSTHFYLRLYGVRHMVKDHSDSEKGNPLPPHRQWVHYLQYRSDDPSHHERTPLPRSYISLPET